MNVSGNVARAGGRGQRREGGRIEGEARDSPPRGARIAEGKSASPYGMGRNCLNWG